MRNHGESLLLVWKNKRRRDGGDDNAGRVVMLGDFQERIAHLFVGCLQFFNRLFNRGDEILLAITSHLGVHAVAFATKTFQLFLCQFSLLSILATVYARLPVDVGSTSPNERHLTINAQLEWLWCHFTITGTDKSLSLAPHEGHFGGTGSRRISSHIDQCVGHTAAVAVVVVSS